MAQSLEVLPASQASPWFERRPGLGSGKLMVGCHSADADPTGDELSPELVSL